MFITNPTNNHSAYVKNNDPRLKLLSRFLPECDTCDTITKTNKKTNEITY